MKLPIYLYGAEVLREPSKEADLNDRDALAALVADMKETLKVADGCGLAAPQVGVGLRVLIVDGTGMADIYDYLKDFRRTMINPVVLEESTATCEYSEGCLSVPGIYADVRRPSKIKVEYYNEDLEKVTEEFDKFACRMVQHELDHLDGNLFVDRVAPIRRKMMSKKLQNISRGKISTHYKTKN
ncbi:MAG: peptide deformylase [Bacteroidales bacterium]|nr:peptide deformylase [Bacteroides sp.]MCM1199173.1 peptide deformylase [Clostridium sp.]MCM1502418.1 peptide deformylase [Bacteroidales bacterium]